MTDEINYEFGIVDSKGNVVYEEYYTDSNCLQGDFYIPATGQYKCYITNYSSDPKTFSGYKVVF